MTLIFSKVGVKMKNKSNYFFQVVKSTLIDYFKNWLDRKYEVDVQSYLLSKLKKKNKHR